MSDAREWLEDYNSCSSPGTVLHDATAALLAVLDACDKFDSESDELAPKGDWGESMGDTVWADALAHASDRVRDAIDKALGMTDE